MATVVDLIAIAQDIAQESCYHIPISKPEWIVQRRYVFVAATAVKEICKFANDEEEVAILVLYAALVVEYAANFSSKSSMSQRMMVMDKLEEIKDILKSMAPEDDFETKTYKSALIHALADDLGVDKPEIRQSIESSFERHKGGPQEAQKFIRDWDRNPENLRLSLFIKENSVSLLALRDKQAVRFLDILEQAARDDSVGTPGEKQLYQTYLRRLSCRSKMLPSAFHLRNIEISPCEPKECIHSSQRGPQQSLAGAYGNVDHAKWKKPTGTVEVAIKSLRNRDQTMLCHEAAFWYYLHPDRMVPFYGVAVVDGSSCLISAWMDGGRICCYVDGKSDSIRLDLLRQVAEGLKYLHDLNFVHCDIKPANILIDTRQSLKALITDFGYSNTARRTNVDYTRSCGYTFGYVRDGNEITRAWDPSNDVYAFGVTCCQVVLVGRRQDIASIPIDIKICLSQLLHHENTDGESIKGQHRPIIQELRQKFFPNEKRPPPPFIEEIFNLVANTCSVPTCKMDDVIELLKRASDVEQRDAQIRTDISKPFTALSVDS